MLAKLTFNQTDFKKLFIELVVYAYILVYIYAAVYKLYDRYFFEQQLLLSPLLGSYAKLLSYLVPWSELLVSVMMMWPRSRTIGLWLSAGIMLGFTLYIAYILTLSSYIPCGCGGILASMGWKEHLVFNSVFVLFSIVAIVFTYQRQKTI